MISRVRYAADFSLYKLVPYVWISPPCLAAPQAVFQPPASVIGQDGDQVVQAKIVLDAHHEDRPWPEYATPHQAKINGRILEDIEKPLTPVSSSEATLR
jgi:hypothetical protein